MGRGTTITLLLFALLHAPGCGERGASRDSRQVGSSSGSRPSVLLVTLDTTRADRLGCYGHEAAGTPHIDSLAVDGVRMSRAYAPAALTLPSHASLLTGAQPPEHGLRDNGRAALGPDATSMAQVFKARGYRTSAVLASRVLDRSFGLDRGFDHYADRFRDPKALARRAEEVSNEALFWLAQDPSGDQPFFMWLHYYDPHAAYQAPEPFASRHEPYDAELAYVDSQLGRILAALEERDEDCLVIVTADHGESLGEHGESSHGIFVYEATQRIPLLIRWPDVLPGGLLVDHPVSLVDVFPTVMELLDWPVPETSSGKSFAPALRGESTSEVGPVYIESEYSRLNFGWSALRGIVDGRWKYIHAAAPELYDLEQDPREQENLIERNPARAAELLAMFQTVEREMRVMDVAGGIDEELSASFEGLGYAQGRVTQGEDADPFTGRVPLEMIDVLERYHRATSLKDTGRFEDMIPDLEVVARACPEGAAFRTVLGICYREVGRRADARAEFEDALKHDPTYEHARQNLAEIQFELDEIDAALRNFEMVVAQNPSHERAELGLAGVYAALERFEDAHAIYAKLAARRPGDQESIGLFLSKAYLERALGRNLEMKRTLEGVVTRFPGEHSVALYLAWELSTNGDPAVRDGKRALEIVEALCPEGGCPDADTVDTLAAALAEAGRFEEAARHAQRALELARDSGDLGLAQAIELRIASYAAGVAHRE